MSIMWFRNFTAELIGLVAVGEGGKRIIIKYGRMIDGWCPNLNEKWWQSFQTTYLYLVPKKRMFECNMKRFQFALKKMIWVTLGNKNCYVQTKSFFLWTPRFNLKTLHTESVEKKKIHCALIQLRHLQSHLLLLMGMTACYNYHSKIVFTFNPTLSHATKSLSIFQLKENDNKIVQ